MSNRAGSRSSHPEDVAASPSAPRVCMLLESYYPVMGGMETQARNMAQSFGARGVHLLILTRRNQPELGRFETVDGIPVHRVGPRMKSSRARWLLVLTCIPALFRLRKEYDIILVPGFRTLGISAVLVGRLLGKRSVLKAESCGEMSGDFFGGGLKGIGLKRSSWLVRGPLASRNRLLAKADALVSLSSEMTDEFRTAGVPPERIHVIPQSADVTRFSPPSPEEKRALRAKLSLPADDLIVTFTGRLVSYKGLPVLAEVWDRMRKTHLNVKLLIVGSGGVDIFNWEAELKRFIEDRGMKDDVILTGGVRNVDEYLKASDIYAFPTENEAFPLALLEAMACGLAVVATSVGGIKDVISDGNNGLMIAPASPDQLQRALERLLSEPALRQTLGAGALKSVLDNYTRDIVTDQYLALFGELNSLF